MYTKIFTATLLASFVFQSLAAPMKLKLASEIDEMVDDKLHSTTSTIKSGLDTGNTEVDSKLDTVTSNVGTKLDTTISMAEPTLDHGASMVDSTLGWATGALEDTAGGATDPDTTGDAEEMLSTITSICGTNIMKLKECVTDTDSDCAKDQETLLVNCGTCFGEGVNNCLLKDLEEAKDCIRSKARSCKINISNMLEGALGSM